MTRKVVVSVHLEFFRNEEGVFAAHSKALGLTGYGQAEGEARASFKRVFSAFIQVSRDEGFLERMLNRIGVEWRWADEYETAYEDVSELAGGEFLPVSTDAASMVA